MRFLTNPRRFALLSRPWTAALGLAVSATAHAATITWSGGSGSSFEDPANWVGGVAPANDLTTDIASFPNNPGQPAPLLSSPRSVNGLRFSNTTGGWSLGGAALALGANGISTVGQSSGLNTITSDVLIGAPQNWRVGSGGTLALTGSLSQSSGHVLSIGASTATGILILNPAPSETISLTGAAGSSTNLVRILGGGVLVCGADGPDGTTGSHVIRNDTGPSFAVLTGGTAEFRSGTWSLGDLGRNSTSDAFYGDLKVTGGDVSFAGGRYLGAGRMTVSGGSLRFPNAGSAVSNGGRFALGSFGTTGTASLDLSGGLLELAPANTGNSFGLAISTRVNHSGGTLRNAISGGGGTNGGSVNTLTLGAGGSISNNRTSYTLSGNGVLLSAGAIQGQAPGTGTGNLSNFNFTGGTLAAAAFNATYLGYSSSTGLAGGTPAADPVANSVGLGTFHNHGGTLAPGGSGSAGRFNLTGNYQANAGQLAIEIGGALPASGFQGPGHDLLAVSGDVSLGGGLSISLLPGFTPAASDSFTVLTASAISGGFANAPSGSRVATTNLSASFLVTIGTAAVTLSDYRLLTPPAITTQPMSSTAILGDSVLLSVLVSSDLPPSFQWRKNGQPIPGAVSASYPIPSVRLENAGSYDVLVTNPAGTVTSNAAVLDVRRFPNEVLGQRAITYDTTGVRPLAQAPPAGVHPRVYFNPDELPAIRQRLTSTAVGVEAMTMIRLYTDLMRRGRSLAYDSRPSSFKLMPDGTPRISNVGLYDKSVNYNLLVSGSVSGTVTNGTTTTLVGVANDSSTGRYVLAGEMALEAFECLIDEGQPGVAQRAANLAAALDTWAQWVVTTPDFPGPATATLNNRSLNQDRFGGHLTALAYDMAHPNLSPTQRDNVRKALAKLMTGYFATDNSDTDYTGVGMAPEAVATNHVTINSFRLITACAIEGEVLASDAGFTSGDLDAWFRRAMGAYHKFFTYGWFSSGAPLEGMGKNYLYGAHMIPYARRGYDFFAHPHVRTFKDQWVPAVTQPFGYSFLEYDLLGGSGPHPERGRAFIESLDYTGMKWMYPGDNAADFAWRNFVLTEYKDTAGAWKTFIDMRDSKFGLRSVYSHQLLPAAIFASDVGSQSTWTQQNAEVQGPLDYLDREGGTLVSRSGHDPDATALVFHVRQDMGGHTFADRNAFTLSALGRLFINYNSGSSNSALEDGALSSIVEINGRSMKITDKEGDKMRIPSKLAAWSPLGGNAVFATGDATYAYSQEWWWNAFDTGSVPLNSGFTADFNTHNTFRRAGNRIPEDFGNTPFVSFPHWEIAGKLEGIQAKPFNPMRQVFRTIGLVRGPQPYALVIDDVRKDDATHSYRWVASIPKDLVLVQGTALPAGADPATDLVLMEPAATGNRRLLLRVLNASGTPVAGTSFTTNPNPGKTLNFSGPVEGGAFAYTQTISNAATNESWKRVVIERSGTVAPDFRILMVPFRAGDPLPATSLGAGVLTITGNGQTDAFTFSPRSADVAGQTVTMNEFTMTRNGVPVLDYRNQIEPAPVRSPSAAFTPPPAAPTFLTAAASGRLVNLSWSDQASGENAYIVERSAAGIEDWTPLATTLPANSRSFIDVTSLENSTYDYRVRCVSPAGLSGYASVAAVATGTGSPSLAPPPPWSVQQVGTASGELPGSVSYNSLSSSFHITGGGGDIWSGGGEAFTFIHQPWAGDGVLTARILSFSSSDTAAKAGIMIRESLTPGAKNAFVYLTPAGSAFFQTKTTTNGSVSNSSSPGKSAPLWIRLIRSGHSFTAFTSPDASNWSQLGTSRTVTLAGTAVRAGLAVGPRTPGTQSSLVIDQVSFVPASATQVPSLDLTAAPVSDSQVRLNWTGDISGLSHWKLERAPAGSDQWSVIQPSLPPATVQFTDSGLDPSTSFEFRLSAHDPSGQIAEEIAGATTPAPLGDGIPGWWRHQHFGNGLAVLPGSSGLLDDPDGDGNPNRTEFLAGTSPLDPASRFHIASITRQGALSMLNLPTVPGRLYQIQRAPSPNGPWTDAAPPVLATGATTTLTVAPDPVDAPAVFFRAKVNP